MTAPEPKKYSREWFVSRLGEDLVAHIEQQAREFPPPTLDQKEAIRRIFAVRPQVPASAAPHVLAA